MHPWQISFPQYVFGNRIVMNTVNAQNMLNNVLLMDDLWKELRPLSSLWRKSQHEMSVDELVVFL